VASGEHHIKDDEIVFARSREVQAVLTIFRHVNREAVFREAPPQVSGGLFLILDNKDLHDVSLCSPERTRSIQIAQEASSRESFLPASRHLASAEGCFETRSKDITIRAKTPRIHGKRIMGKTTLA